jgi:hypothetical protein
MTAVLKKACGTVVWCMSFVPFGLGWLVMSALYLLCCFAGAVFGTQYYVSIQAAERDQAYLARVLHVWSLGFVFDIVKGVVLHDGNTPVFEPMTGSLGNHLIHQPSAGFGQ